MHRGFKVTIVGLLAVCAFLMGLLASRQPGLAAHAETSGQSPNMIAVTGLIGSGVSVLYVIDTEKKQLAVYNAIGGKELRFVAARRIRYDMELREFNDKSPRLVRVKELERRWKAENEKDDPKKNGRRERK
ncbi:MAG: hypothetical protein ACYTGX_08800 [Planctomycetota bacterium]|jgi:hypothetical protein